VLGVRVAVKKVLTSREQVTATSLRFLVRLNSALGESLLERRKIPNVKVPFVYKKTSNLYSCAEGGKITQMLENLQISECFTPLPQLSF